MLVEQICVQSSTHSCFPQIIKDFLVSQKADPKTLFNGLKKAKPKGFTKANGITKYATQ